MKYLSKLVLLAMAVVLIGRAAEADVTEADFAGMNITIEGCLDLLEAIDGRTFRNCSTDVGDEVDKLRGGVCVGGMMWHEKYSDQDFIDVEACLRSPWGTQPEGVVNESVESALRPAHDAKLATSPSTVAGRDSMCLPKVKALKRAMTKFQRQARTCKKEIKNVASGSHLVHEDGTAVSRKSPAVGILHGEPDLYPVWWIGYEETHCVGWEDTMWQGGWDNPKTEGCALRQQDIAAPDGICLDWGAYHKGQLEHGGYIEDGAEYGRSWWTTDEVYSLNNAWKEAQESCNFYPTREQ
jgi:hypothetical protein